MWKYVQFTPPVACLSSYSYFPGVFAYFQFSFLCQTFLIVLVLIFIYLKHNTMSSISPLLYQTILLHNLPMFFYDSGTKWCWRWSTFNFLGMVTIVFLLLSKSLLYSRTFIMFINFCLYSHYWPTGNNSVILSNALLPACYSKATWNGGLQLLGVHRFLHALYHLCVCPFISTVEQTLG